VFEGLVEGFQLPLPKSLPERQAPSGTVSDQAEADGSILAF
jgi:hypothetical protein